MVTKKRNKIVIISPVRDEEELIGKTIQSMINQTIKPVEWLIVDDGSKDKTLKIVTEAAREYDWIYLEKKEDRGVRAVGPGVVEAFYYGYERLHTQDYNFICKLDGDLEFDSKYFETLLSFFAQDPYLGAASGKPFLKEGEHLVEERMSDEMVAGQINFYRRQCFEDIGGFVREVHWDGIAFHKARMKGWRTKSFRHPNLRFIHQRLMGSSHKGILHGRRRWGKGQYFMGTHPLYVLAIGIYRMAEKPFVIGGLSIVMGYFQSMAKSMPRYEDLEFRKSLHAWQFERMKLGKRLEIIPPHQKKNEELDI
jgi:biofilm PGA synthesis N-glycosyltransferase PgaC